MATQHGMFSQRGPEGQDNQDGHGNADVEANEDDPLVPKEEKGYTIKPFDSVYSFMLFMPPREHSQTGKYFTWTFFFAFGLIVLNFVMQFSLLFIAGHFVIEEHEAWISSVLHQPETKWYELHKWVQHSDKECHDGASLCFEAGGLLTCAPPTIQFFHNWEHFDLNGDGVWSLEEAADESFRKTSKCNYNADSLVVFGTLVDALKSEPRLNMSLHPNVTQGLSVHKSYFSWWQGEVALCMYGDPDMCGNLFERGVFDEAISLNDTELAVHDLPSARAFCNSMLSTRCEQFMPSSYRIWKISTEAACGAKSYSSIAYDSPDNNPNNLFTKLDFHSIAEYAKGRSACFMLYVAVLFVTFFSTMLEEWKQIYRVFLWTYQAVPVVKDVKEHTGHRYLLLFLNTLRFILWLVLMYVGTIFLTSGTSYLDLIFDAVSLVFIIQIDDLLYQTILRAPMKSVHGDMDGINIKRKRLPLSVMTLESMMVVLMVVATVVVAGSYCRDTLQPLETAVNCACMTDGPGCFEASLYDKAWWDNYWTKTVPDSRLRIEQLMDEALDKQEAFF